MGDVADPEVVGSTMDGVDVVFHEAALGSVKRSLEAPMATNRANVDGTLVVLDAARHAGVRRVVAASSSSVYGGVAPLPSTEDFPPVPRSPYAITKVALEHYCRVYSELLGLETVCLRYFNVFGPRQRDDSEYAAAIPIFTAALLAGERPLVYGDGLQSRDFTYVGDVVRANLLAVDAPADRCVGRVYNVAGGHRHTVLDLLAMLGRILGVEAEPRHADERPGDVRHSEADLAAIARDIGFTPKVDLETGLREMLAWRQSTNTTMIAER